LTINDTECHNFNMSATAIPFSPALIGQVEKSLNAFLQRQLARPGLTETQWVTLSLTIMSGASLDHEQLVTRVAGALKTGDAAAEAEVSALDAMGLIAADASGIVDVTDPGRAIFDTVRSASGQYTQRLWGDIAAEDLEAAGRVLSTILARANAEFAR
jgi:DNA-binding MarR family transcriptional regulator